MNPLDLLFQLLELAVPVIVGAVSVPIFGLVKNYALPWIGKQKPIVQQLLLVVQTWAFGLLSHLVGFVLPASLSGFELSTYEQLAAVGIAYAIHAGKKAAGRATT